MSWTAIVLLAHRPRGYTGELQVEGVIRRKIARRKTQDERRKKSTIDSDLVFQFADLALAEQEDLASAIGSMVELILDNLLEA
jgi:hypothetical protein